MKRIEELLGRKLTSAEFHSVPTLNEVTKEVVGDLRKLESRSQIDYYLSHVVAERYRSNDGESFVNDVVANGADPKTWGFREVFVFLEEVDKRHFVRTSWESARRELLQAGGSQWWWSGVSRADRVNDGLWSSAWGAVGVRVDHVPYWWRHPKGTLDASCDDEREAGLHQVDETTAQLKFRRWVALRCSWWCRAESNYTRDSTPASEEAILALLGVARTELSVDGAVAVRALAREAALQFDPKRHVRGFIGPDAWYADAP